MKIVPQRDCVDSWHKETKIDDSLICTAGDGGTKSACNGDSGGKWPRINDVINF